MKDTKRKFPLYSFYDHTHIAAMLERQAAEGWMLEQIGGFGWKFRRMEPKKLRFAVSYYPPASAYDPEPSEGELDLRAFCERTGWKLAAASGQMQVFYHEREDAVPIETDPAVEVENIHRAAKRSFLPSQFALLALGILNIALRAGMFFLDPIGTLASGADFFSEGCFLILIVTCLVELCGYCRWRARARLAAGRGEFLPTPDHRPFQWVMLALLGAIVVLFAAGTARSADGMLKFVFALSALWIVLLLAGVFGLQTLLKRKKAPAKVNRAVTLAAAIVLAFGLMGGVIFAVFRLNDTGLFNPAAEKYTWGDGRHTFTAYQDELPLSVEDLTGIPDEKFSRSRSEDGSPLLGRLEGDQRGRLDVEEAEGELPWLEYTVVEVRFPPLYGWVRDRLRHERDDDWELFRTGYTPADPGPWGADEAWELWDFEYDRSRGEFLLCYERRIVVIRFGYDWAPTPEQRAIVGEKLGK